jgi:hypothetical protein
MSSHLDTLFCGSKDSMPVCRFSRFCFFFEDRLSRANDDQCRFRLSLGLLDRPLSTRPLETKPNSLRQMTGGGGMVVSEGIAV